MSQNQQIPTSRFKEAEADRLIATYGAKQPDDGRQKTKDMLRGFKKDFIAAQKDKEKTRSQGGPQRGM